MLTEHCSPCRVKERLQLTWKHIQYLILPDFHPYPGSIKPVMLIWKSWELGTQIHGQTLLSLGTGRRSWALVTSLSCSSGICLHVNNGHIPHIQVRAEAECWCRERSMYFTGKANTRHLAACASIYSNLWSCTVWGCQGEMGPGSHTAAEQTCSSYPAKITSVETSKENHKWFSLLCPVHPHGIKWNPPKTLILELKTNVRNFSPKGSKFFSEKWTYKVFLILKFLTMFQLFSDEYQTGLYVNISDEYQTDYMWKTFSIVLPWIPE